MLIVSVKEFNDKVFLFFKVIDLGIGMIEYFMKLLFLFFI